MPPASCAPNAVGIPNWAPRAVRRGTWAKLAPMITGRPDPQNFPRGESWIKVAMPEISREA